MIGKNSGRSHNIQIDNRSFERVEEFKYLGNNLKRSKSIEEDYKSRLKSGNACYYSVQNLLSYGLLSKNLNIEIHRTTKLPVVFAWVRNLVAYNEGGT